MSALRREFDALAAEVFADPDDPRAFCGLLEIPTKQGELQPFTYDEWNAEQKAFLDSMTMRDLVLKARQIGMTTLLMALALFFVLTHRGVQALIVSHDEGEVERMFDQVRAWVVRLVELNIIPKPKFSTKREQTWAFNRSTLRVVAAGATEMSAKKKGRSGTIHWLHATEMAFWGAAAETMTALMAAAENGYVVIESTANGAQGMFHKLCTTPDGSWLLHFFPWYEHEEYRSEVPDGFDPAVPVGPDGKPDADEARLRELGCDDEQIAWWREKIADPARGGREKVKQEYPIDPVSCFVMPGGAFLDAASCDWLATKARDPIAVVPMTVTIKVDGRESQKHVGDLLVFTRPGAGVKYLVPADVSEGIEGDESAMEVQEGTTGETCATFASNTITPGDLAQAMAFAGRMYGDALLAPERNNHGHTVLLALESVESSHTPYANVYMHDDDRLGWLTTTATRPPMMDDLKQGIRDRSISSPDISFAQQSRTLVRSASGKAVAMNKGLKDGARDDRWIAKAIGNQVRQRVSFAKTVTKHNVTVTRPYDTATTKVGVPSAPFVIRRRWE